MATLDEMMQAMSGKPTAASRSREFDHQQFNPNVFGADALKEWLKGVKERTLHPLEALAKYSQDFQKMSPVDQGLQLAGGGLAGTFAGVGAKTANLAKLELAQKLKQQGVPDRDIYAKTGWTFGFPDSKPRFEIPDNKAYYDPKALTDLKSWSNFNYKSDTQPMGGVVSHKDLYSAYPSVEDIPVHFMPKQNMKGAYGAYSENLDRITLGDIPENQINQSLHELQHAIQQREGFARGGSPEMFNQQAEAEIARDALSFKSELLKKKEQFPQADTHHLANLVVEDYNKIGAMNWLPSREAMDLALQPYVLYGEKNYPKDLKNVQDLVALYGLDKQTSPYKPMDIYKRLAGEAEARLTQARMNMTPEQRAASYPLDMFDVPVNEQIVRYDKGNALSLPKTKYELAHELAQRNAALPVDQGGLGLPANNTAMDRAKAMGYQRADDGMDFMSEHRPPMSDSGAPLHDLTGGGNIYPDDVYSVNAARYYGTGDPTDNQLFRKIQSYKNKPEEKIRMFRAVPSDVMKSQGNTIHHGDWITPSRQYAVEHGESALGGDYRIQAGNFPAKSVFTNGDSPYEFGLDKSQYFADAPASVPLMRGTGFNSQDRSRFAAFDPLKRNSSDLLASLLPITTTGLLANQLRQSLWAEPQPD